MKSFIFFQFFFLSLGLISITFFRNELPRELPIFILIFSIFIGLVEKKERELHSEFSK